jgi:hypothetical protein
MLNLNISMRSVSSSRTKGTQRLPSICKKKELLGNSKNNGREWQVKGAKQHWPLAPMSKAESTILVASKGQDGITSSWIRSDQSATNARNDTDDTNT